jgi:hypothetical protein
MASGAGTIREAAAQGRQEYRSGGEKRRQLGEEVLLGATQVIQVAHAANKYFTTEDTEKKEFLILFSVSSVSSVVNHPG